jgi:hypothetical protein
LWAGAIKKGSLGVERGGVESLGSQWKERLIRAKNEGLQLRFNVYISPSLQRGLRGLFAGGMEQKVELRQFLNSSVGSPTLNPTIQRTICRGNNNGVVKLMNLLKLLLLEGGNPGQKVAG